MTHGKLQSLLHYLQRHLNSAMGPAAVLLAIDIWLWSFLSFSCHRPHEVGQATWTAFKDSSGAVLQRRQLPWPVPLLSAPRFDKAHGQGISPETPLQLHLSGQRPPQCAYANLLQLSAYSAAAMGYDVVYVCPVQGHSGHTAVEDPVFESSAMCKCFVRQLQATQLHQ